MKQRAYQPSLIAPISGGRPCTSSQVRASGREGTGSVKAAPVYSGRQCFCLLSFPLNSDCAFRPAEPAGTNFKLPLKSQPVDWASWASWWLLHASSLNYISSVLI